MKYFLEILEFFLKISNIVFFPKHIGFQPFSLVPKERNGRKENTNF